MKEIFIAFITGCFLLQATAQQYSWLKIVTLVITSIHNLSDLCCIHDNKDLISGSSLNILYPTLDD
jgi:hypothetical protein